MKTPKMLFTLLPAALLLLDRCGDQPLSMPGGGGSETVNARVIADANSITVAVKCPRKTQTAIGVYSSDYEPWNDSGTALTHRAADTLHAWLFDSLAAGTYNVLVTDSAADKSVIFKKIIIPSQTADTMCDTVSRTAAAGGGITNKSNGPLPRFCAFVKGTPCWTPVDSASRRFTLGHLPAGENTIELKSTSTHDWGSKGILATTITLAPGAENDSLIFTIGN